MLELEYRNRQGATPTQEEYVRRFPHYQTIIGDLFARLSAIQEETNGGAATAPSSLRSATENPPSCLAEHPRYRVIRLIGSGGMGSVYLAEHRLMQRAVALKVIQPEYVGDSAAHDRFHREIRLAAKLHHAHIVTAFDAEQHGDCDLLAMEYVEGQDLARYVANSGRLSIGQACEFVRQAALGLQHAHELGMAHRDIKPHNLMLTAAGTIKILDFGLRALRS